MINSKTKVRNEKLKNVTAPPPVLYFHNSKLSHNYAQLFFDFPIHESHSIPSYKEIYTF